MHEKLGQVSALFAQMKRLPTSLLLICALFNWSMKARLFCDARICATPVETKKPTVYCLSLIRRQFRADFFAGSISRFSSLRIWKSWKSTSKNASKLVFGRIPNFRNRRRFLKYRSTATRYKTRAQHGSVPFSRALILFKYFNPDDNLGRNSGNFWENWLIFWK